MRKQEHNYELRGYKFGFRIIPKDEKRPILYVGVNKNGFWDIGRKLNRKLKHNIPLYSFYTLLDSCVNELYESWVCPKKSKSDSVNFMMERWSKTQTRRTLARKMRDIWKNCCNNLNPEVEELHRKLYSISNGSGYWERIQIILNNRKEYKFLIKDMLKYPAARLAVLHGDFGLRLWNVTEEMEAWDRNWMKVYSDNIYTSLRKTLMNFPYGVTYYFYFALGNIYLPEPVTTRIRMFAYTTLGRKNLEDDEKEDRVKVILRSTDDEIKEAVRYMWRHFPLCAGGDNFRKRSSIIHSLHMIFDYPYPVGEWDIIGLAKRSEKYHHYLDMQAREERMRWEKQNEELMKAKTALPAIPLPEDENIKFLESYSAVNEEGNIMGHCIAQYANRAVKGNCYLFHVDYAGEMASVEVSPQGYVVQSYGPKDRINKASEYGRSELGKWAKKLVKEKPKQELVKTGETVDELGVVWEHMELAEIPVVPYRAEYADIPF